MTKAKKEIQDILNGKFEVPWDILRAEETSFQEMDFDSLDIADLIVEIEKQTGKEVEYENLIKLRTLGDLYKYLDSIW